jgi:Mg2+-importing ATPase
MTRHRPRSRPTPSIPTWALSARWDVDAIQRFVLVFGPISSVFDFLTFGLLLLVLGQNEKAFHTG